MKVWQRIKEQRQKRKLTQKELANKINVSPQVISNWERNYTTPDAQDIAILAAALEISTDYLYGLTNDPYPKKSTQDNYFDSLAEINKMVKEFGIEQMGFFDIDKWKDLTPEDVDEIRRHFEWVTQKAKERK